MATTIKLKNSVTTTNAPSSLVQGEVAINITDKKVWVGNAATTPIQLLGDGGSVNFTTVDTTNLQVTNIKAKDGTASASIANSTGAFTVAAAFAANGGATLGDASGDALTINSSAVSIPNGLNFDSNTLVIDAANNRVGIGTSSPTTQLEIKSAQFTDSEITLDNTSSNTTSRILFKAAGTEYGRVTGDSTQVLLQSGNIPIAFRTNGSERMRISSAGTLFIGGTSSPSGTQRLVLTANGGDGIEPMLFNELRSTSATENYVLFYRNGSQVGSITNTLSATAYNTSSDYRLKENITPMSGALAKVAQLKPVTYTWKVDGSNGQGFIAHELQAVVPDCVTGEKDAVDEEGNPRYQGVDTSFLVATLTAAIQEQQAMIEELKQEVALLKSK